LESIMSKRFGPAIAVAALIFPLGAWAHAKLLRTSPAAASSAPAAPGMLTLDFNEGVQLAMLKLSSAGKELPVPFNGSASAAHVAVPLPALAPGTYQVRWSALTVDDGHVVKGTFSFVIKP
jgi:methionine-rich copper-binding protein CopC